MNSLWCLYPERADLLQLLFIQAQWAFDVYRVGCLNDDYDWF